MIAVIGLGTGGCKIVQRLAQKNSCEHIHFIGMDTDAGSAQRVSGIPFVLIGQRTCRGWGSGNSTEVGEMACLESKEHISLILTGYTQVIFISTLGGGTGGAHFMLVKQALALGVNVHSLVTIPFKFQGVLKRHIANESLNRIYLEHSSVSVYDFEELITRNLTAIPIYEGLNLFDRLMMQKIELESDVVPTLQI